MGIKIKSKLDDTYKPLKVYKLKNENSDIIRKLATNKKDIMKFAGALKISNDEAEEIKGIIEKLRKISCIRKPL